MWHLLEHYREDCTSESQRGFCSHCGKRAAETEASGSNMNETMGYAQQDELSQLFARNMQFSQALPQHPVTPDKQFFSQNPTETTPIYASQHYIHSSYHQPSHDTVRSDSPLELPADNVELTLRQHDINPASLFPSQIKLFTCANYEQRLRLLELWRIAPPEYGNRDLAAQSNGAWPQTSLGQEEEMAKLRYERRMREREQSGQFRDVVHTADAEPYIAAGYADSRRSDPVYATAQGLWQPPSYEEATRSMQDQYGAMDQARNFEQLQHINRQVEMQNQHGSYDDDMVM